MNNPNEATIYTAWGAGVDYSSEEHLRRGIAEDDTFHFVNGETKFTCPPSHLPPKVRVVYKYRRHTRSITI